MSQRRLFYGGGVAAPGVHRPEEPVLGCVSQRRLFHGGGAATSSGRRFALLR